MDRGTEKASLKKNPEGRGGQPNSRVYFTFPLKYKGKATFLQALGQQKFYHYSSFTAHVPTQAFYILSQHYLKAITNSEKNS